MKRPTHKEIKDYLSKQEICGLKKGDIIKIVRKAETYENGWNNSWDSAYMDRYVDRIGTITNMTDYGIFVNDISVSFPYFILEKISSKKDVRERKYKDQIDLLWDLKEIAVMIYHQTDENYDVRDLMCTIDETIGALEKIKE